VVTQLTVHSSNLAMCLRLLESETNQFAFATLLDPRSFGTPQSRPRYWIPAINLSLMEALQVSKSEVYKWSIHFLERFNDFGLVPLSDLLFAAEHPTVRDLLLAAKDSKQYSVQ
jgi:hypothetical protein